MTSKKSNFLPLLLIGGGLAGAALLYGFGAKQSKEDSSLFGGVGVGGSGDFLGSSGISKGYDSVDLGVEDYAFNRATPDAFALPSDGAANPESVVDESGVWTFADTAVLGLTAAATVPTVAKAVKSVGSKVAGSAGRATIGRTVGTVAKGAGIVGLGALTVDAVESGLSLGSTVAGYAPSTLGTVFKTVVGGTLQKIGVVPSTVTTDEAAKENVGNMVTNRQLAHATGLSAGKYPVTVASKEETALVNKAVGLSSGDVLKVSGGKFTSYIPEKGMQVTFSSGGTLAGTVNSILANKARKEA